MSAKTTELKPCPFCGSGNVRYKEAEHAVVCARCKARGSIAPDEEMAIRMWDERAGELKPDSWEKLEEDVMNRARKRGRALPKRLEEALVAQASSTTREQALEE